MNNWIETKRESEIDNQGNLIPKTVTTEPEKLKESLWKYNPKEIIDLSLKFVGIIAIVVPVLLFYKGQQAERDKQKALFQLQIYTDATTLMHELADKRPGTAGSEESRNKLFYQIYPKLRLLNDKPIIDTFRILKDIIDITSMSYGLFNDADSLDELLRPVDSRVMFEKQDPDFFKEVARKCGEFRGRALNLMYKMGDWKNDTDSSKKYINYFLPEIDSMNKKFFETVEDEARMANGVYRQMQKMPDSIRWGLPEPKDDLIDNIADTRRDFETNIKKYIMPYTSKIDSMMIRSSHLLYNQ